VLQPDIPMPAIEWQTIFDEAEYTVLLVDQFDRMVQLNQVAKGGLKKHSSEIIGQNIETIGYEQPWRKIAELVRHVKKARSGLSCQVMDEPRGTTWNITVNPVARQEVSIDQIVIVARDVTQQRQRDALAMVGALITSVAHQVRNPLFGISSALDVLEVLFGDREEYREYFSILRSGVYNLNVLMQDILEYSIPPIKELSPGDIEDVIAQAISSCKPLAVQSDVKIVSNIQKRIAPIPIDKNRLVQAFVNILENAIQHSPSGETVIVEARMACLENQGWIECLVRDKGPGFSPDDLPKVFEPFFTRRREGTGLGLPIAKQIVKEHGGDIGVGNGSEGGAIIKIVFEFAVND
jgi:signal transduction histidine kinase